LYNKTYRAYRGGYKIYISLGGRNMDYKARYEEWISNSYFDEDTRAELESIKEDENEIKERFYMDLEFGTAGLRGIIGAGTNRMNIYTVRKATQGRRFLLRLQ